MVADEPQNGDEYVGQSYAAPFDSELGQLKELYALMQSALTDSENRHDKRDRRDRAALKVMKAIAESRLFDHRACMAVSKEMGDECSCGYTALATELFDILAVRAAEVDEVKAEREEHKKIFQQLKRSADK